MTQPCGACRHLNPDQAKFCLECGTPMARACATCGQPLVPGAKFCMECGTPLAGPPPAPAAAGPVSERRTTTVLFGDLVSFTTLAETRDPEEVRELLSAYFVVARTIVGRYGGVVEKFIGDAVMAVWGVPTSHEDDAERAVRAGLDLVAEVAALGASVGAPELSMRVGVVTGSVAVTLGAVGEGMVAGDAVNTAARVQTAADPGTVWVDQETRGLTAAAIAFSDMGEHPLKGKADPARLFRADAVVAAVGGAQRVDGLEAAMVGRDADLRMVKEQFHATEADGRARLVLVTGVAGVGKSRLGWEYEKYTDGLDVSIAWHRGRCLSYGDGVAYWAFAEMIRSRLGLVDGQPREEVEERVRTRVGELAADRDEAAWLTPRVLALVTAGERTTFDRTDLFVAWTTFVDRVGGPDPVVMLVEDVQHADAAMLDLLEHLLATTRARLFVLALGRPDVLEHRPGLLGGRRTTHVDLGPLPTEVVGTLVDGLVRDLPTRARAAIVARADGIPLYAVETVRSLIDRDAVVARDGAYVFVDHDHSRVDLDQLAAPTSLQTLIAARLDALTPAERRTSQDASVLGMAFTRDGLTALSDLPAPEVDLAVEGLVRKGVLEQPDDPFAPDRGQLRFLQALVREVAHGTLSRRDRRLRHLAAADHLAGLAVADEVAGVIAQHLLDALDAGPADDREAGRLRDRARTLLEQSADAAEALGSPAEALRARTTALGLHPGADERATLLLGAARAAQVAGLVEEAEAHVRDASAAALELGLTHLWVAVQRQHSRLLVTQSRLREGLEVATQALTHASAADPTTVFDLHSDAGSAARALGDLDTARHHSLRGTALAETFDDPSRLVTALNHAGAQAAADGLPTINHALTRTALDIARSSGQILALGQTLSNLASSSYPDALEPAREHVEEAVRVNLSTGQAYLSELSLMNAGFIYWLTGAWDQVEAGIGAWLDDHDPTPTCGGGWLMRLQVWHARGEHLVVPPIPPSDDTYDQLAICLAAGDAAGVATALPDHVTSGVDEDFEILLAPAVELLLRHGDVDTAAALLEAATPVLDLHRRQALTRAEVPRLRGLVTLARGGDPETDLREAADAHEAYGAPYLLARTRLELGRWLHGRGRSTEGRLLLDQARETFVVLRATPSISEVDAVLTARDRV